MSVHSTKNATKTACKTMLVRLALGTTATAALLLVAAAPASAINQDHADRAGVMFPAPSPAPYATASSGGVDVSSAALGALGGIALGGAGLALTLGVQRRRDHTAARPA
ncbi:hypothetical protein ACGFIF_31150 [Kribbella sp. NPDC049174]|uniref:hypothetical protein n=1 Tax=Kribbella sp. NPDC049174 TaxID=3364112 RepID=UPI003721D2E7